MHFAVWRNTFINLKKLILQFREIHFAIVWWNLDATPSILASCLHSLPWVTICCKGLNGPHQARQYMSCIAFTQFNVLYCNVI